MTPADAAPMLTEACEAALAWVDAIEHDDGGEALDQMYWSWLELMGAAVAQART